MKKALLIPTLLVAFALSGCSGIDASMRPAPKPEVVEEMIVPAPASEI